MKAIFFSIVMLAFLSGCSSASEPKASEDRKAQDFKTVKLSIRADDNSLEQKITIACSSEQEFCAKLASEELLAPLPQDVACTDIYGGPQVIEVVADGDKTVAKTFTRANGCEIASFDTLAKLLDSVTTVDVQVPGWDPEV